MADLQRVLPHDDALDQQPQDLLPLGEAGRRQSAPHTVAERLQVCPYLPGLLTLRPQPRLLLVLGGQRLAAAGNLLTAILQLRQVDDPGLVGIEQPLFLAVDAPHLCLRLAFFRTRARLRGVRLARQRLELFQQSFRIVEQLLNVPPDGSLQCVGLHRTARAGAVAVARDAVLAVAFVVAVLHLAGLVAEGDAEHGQAARPARQQAP
jgi:hypothetical protein